MEKTRVRSVIRLLLLACVVVLCMLSFRLIWPPGPRLIPADTQFTLEHKLLLNGYVNQTYGRLVRTEGHAAAMKAIGQKLDSLKIVKSWKLDVETNEVWITFTDGEETVSMLPWPEEIKHRTEERDRKK